MLKRKKPLKKKSSAASTVKKLDDLCRALIFARDDHKCQLSKAGMGSCGGYLQACHIYGKGAHKGMRFEPDNVIAGCWRHHHNLSPYSWHANPMVYVEWFKDEYPERAERLRLMSQEERSINAVFYAEERGKLLGLLRKAGIGADA